MAQQTAVEWLMQNIEKTLPNFIEAWRVEYEQAKQIEKEQIKDCWDTAHQAGRFEGKGIAEENWQTFEQYYNETYKNK